MTRAQIINKLEKAGFETAQDEVAVIAWNPANRYYTLRYTRAGIISTGDRSASSSERSFWPSLKKAMEKLAIN